MTKEELEIAVTEKIEEMNVAQLRGIGYKHGIDIPEGYSKDKAIGCILAWAGQEDGESEQLISFCETIDLDYEPEKQDYVIEYENRTLALEKEVAMAAVGHAYKDAEAKAAKKEFENLRDELSRHLSAGPKPLPLSELTPELDFDGDGQQAKQAGEVLEKCPECGGLGHDGKGAECINCEGTGKITTEG